MRLGARQRRGPNRPTLDEAGAPATTQTALLAGAASGVGEAIFEEVAGVKSVETGPYAAAKRTQPATPK